MTKPELPDRLSVDKKSPFYNADVLAHQVGVRFKGTEKSNVAEYCISEGWVRTYPVNGPTDSKGNRISVKLQGKVEVYYKGENQ